MIIVTATQNGSLRTGCALFDTQTGIKYRLSIGRDDFESVKVDVESAHTISFENGYAGVCYWEDEAIDFWRQLIDGMQVNSTVADDSLYEAAKAIDDRKFRRNLEAFKKDKPSTLDEVNILF